MKGGVFLELYYADNQCVKGKKKDTTKAIKPLSESLGIYILYIVETSVHYCCSSNGKVPLCGLINLLGLVQESQAIKTRCIKHAVHVCIVIYYLMKRNMQFNLDVQIVDSISRCLPLTISIECCSIFLGRVTYII